MYYLANGDIEDFRMLTPKLNHQTFLAQLLIV